MNNIVLYHGSDHIINSPNLNFGNSKNDYGKGFYCTQNEQMAREWACINNTNGFVNVYSFLPNDLKILNLLDGKHNILQWITILLEHRTFSISSEIAEEARNYLIEHFSIDLSDYDVVIGYRADDSYFRYAEDFITNALPLRSLNKALKLGKLGEQTVLISKKSFDNLKFTESKSVLKDEFYPQFIERDSLARNMYKNEIRKSQNYKDDIFVMDILRAEMKADDPRIQQNLS